MVVFPIENDSMPLVFPQSPTTVSVAEDELGFTVTTRWTPDCSAIAAFAAVRTELGVWVVAVAAALRAIGTTSAAVANPSPRARRRIFGRAKRSTPLT